MRLTTLMSMAARVVVPKDYRYGTNRPWTEAAKRLNPPGKKRRKVFVEPIAPEEWSVLRGDTVRRILNPLLTEIISVYLHCKLNFSMAKSHAQYVHCKLKTNSTVFLETASIPLNICTIKHSRPQSVNSFIRLLLSTVCIFPKSHFCIVTHSMCVKCKML